MKPLRSIATRLAAMFAVAALLVFSLLGLALDEQLGEALRQQQLEQLNTRFDDINYILTRLREPEQWQRIHAKLDALTPPDSSIRYWILSDDPQVRYGRDLAEIIGIREVAGYRAAPGIGELRIGSRHEPMLTRSAYFAANAVHPAFRFIVGVDSASYARTRHAFRSVLLLCIAIGVPLVAAIGYVIAHLGLAPLRRLSREAHALSPSALSQRLDPRRLPRELSDLAASFNGALDRLETTYKQLESFNADVTHELRTPLANLIGQTQVALSRERSAGELVETLESNLEDLGRLSGIVNDMLFLARADLGERPQLLSPSSLAAEVGKTVDFLDFLVEEAGVRVQVEGEVLASVEPALFQRAVVNLLHNAIRHSEPHSTIVVALSREDSHARIAVANRGPAIPKEHIGRLFDRFYRVDMARSNSGDSHGLGLAIVKAVALMHGGTVFAESDGGVTTVGFTVALAGE